MWIRAGRMTAPTAERGAPGSCQRDSRPVGAGGLSVLGRTGAAPKASSCPQPWQTLPVQKICPHWPCGPGGQGPHLAGANLPASHWGLASGAQHMLE